MRPTAASLRQWLLRLLLKRLLLLLLPILQWPAKAHDADGFVGAPHRGPGPLPKREVLLLSQTSPERPKSPEPTQENSGKLTLFKKPHQTAAFDTFGPGVRTHSDAQHLFIESTGLPSHPMMIGITAWQQQVPLPQSYTGANAWQIPLSPVPSKTPVSIKGRFLRGAVAIAVNGIPIFNPQNNRGEISAEIGELDQWGGHCGRADDYHYHAAPLHLQQALSERLPIAYALDGYPLYGITEPDGSQPAALDAFNGHQSPTLGYHYHASTRYPYVNGGFYGEVTEREGQVDPQPAAIPVRDAGRGLRGAKITSFETVTPTSWKLTYELSGETRQIRYSQNPNGSFDFEFQNGREGTQHQLYTPRRGGGAPPGKPAEGREGRPPNAPRPRGDPAQRPTPPQDASLPGANHNSPRRNPDPNGGPRKPWIHVHGAEIDVNHDGTITAEEFLAEAKRSFARYDRNGDGKLTLEEYSGPGGVRSPMGGFIKEHAADIDSNKDGTVTFEEFSTHVRPMFEKQDRNRDGKLTTDEWRDLPPGDATPPPQANRPDPPDRPRRPGEGSNGQKPRIDPKR